MPADDLLPPLSPFLPLRHAPCLSLPAWLFSLGSFDRRTNKDKGVVLTQRVKEAENFTLTKINYQELYSSGHLCLTTCCRLRECTADLTRAYTLC